MGAGHDHTGHDHSGHGGHGHGVSADADRRWLSIALALILGFMGVEVVVGLLADSLALLSDAAHMLTDAAAIVLALVAMRLAARPPRGGYTYGLKRAEILSAQANGITLLLLAAWLAYEAIQRLIHPPDVRGGAVLVTAIAGVGVNLVAAWCLSRANRTSLNIEGAFQHILNDLFAFIATAIAGLIVLTTGFDRADGIASLVVVVLMVKAGVELLGASGRILLEAAPAGLSPDALGAELACVTGVVEVHDLHVWQVTSGYPALSAHILVQPGGDCHAVRRDVEALLRGEHHIAHTTLQVDHTDEHDTPAAIAAAHCADPHGAVYRPPHA
ncbi:putative cation transporter [Catellatospora sp. TT07R-123]|uniref:cation diffusion facilitator family transporter n=1 Tax=Catellatospora sp. TT07R-123 TaxID=2733863 RepID=UPI001B2F22E0|nr:cation diffusion facilitator family transporter [Catellatospora sp. TT07R-123]GHJ49896.1 putative cation transporter [Catellatospora sp. TT07R-123]